VFPYGGPGVLPGSGDWDGDGIDTVLVYDPALGTWFLRGGNGSGSPDGGLFRFGGPAAMPVTGAWKGGRR
jgi:hypothetical protein